MGQVADQRQHDDISVNVRQSTRHSVPQFAHEQCGLICREELVGVVVVEAEYAFDLWSAEPISANEVRATLSSRSDFCSSVVPKDGL